MRKIIAFLLMLAGLGLVWHGFQVRNSLKGRTQAAGSELHQTWNGNPTVTDATWFTAGGGVLLAVGLAVALKR